MEKSLPLPLDVQNCKYPWLWLGTWSMGGEGFGFHDLSLSVKTLEMAFEYGIRHFDTAGFYASGRSEELLKKVFGKKRRKIFISTKGGLKRKGKRVWHDATPASLKEDLFKSLERLDTDYIDLFQLHWPDPKVPLDESLSALEDLKRQGLIRFVGAGNLTKEQVEKYIMPYKRLFHQVHFNPIHKKGLSVLKAGRVLDRCINCIISPFEQGLLASPSLFKKRLGKKDIRNRNPYFKDKNIKKFLENFFDICAQRGISPVTAVINWIISHKEVDVIVPGPKTPKQLLDIMNAISNRCHFSNSNFFNFSL